MLVVCNFTQVPRENYRLGVPEAGPWREVMNSDREVYGGSGVKNERPVEADASASHGQPFSLHLNLPPLGAIFLKPVEPAPNV
jgi:1,4-alpha-glucan branching enzyme